MFSAVDVRCFKDFSMVKLAPFAARGIAEKNGLENRRVPLNHVGFPRCIW